MEKRRLSAHARVVPFATRLLGTISGTQLSLAKLPAPYPAAAFKMGSYWSEESVREESGDKT